MKFPVIRDSTSARAGSADVLAELRGQNSRSFAETNDDGTRTFPDIDPGTSPGPQDEQTAQLLVRDRVTRNYLMTLRRDAQHAQATRGELLLHGARNRLLGLHDAEWQMNLAFT